MNNDFFTQTQSDIMLEFEEHGIEVNSREFETMDDDPTNAIIDLFVSSLL